MSIVSAPQPNGSLVKPLSSVCYNNNLVLSQGIFLGDNPFKFSLPVMMLELPLIFITTSAIHHFLRPYGQCRVVSQILSGILLGRTFIGRNFAFRSEIFPIRGTYILDTVSFLSLILFFFSIAVKTDLGLLKKPGKRAVAISIAGAIAPFALSMTTYHFLENSFSSNQIDGNFIFQLVLRLSCSSFAVVADTLEELGLLNSELGRLSMSACLIMDLMNWIIMTSIEVKNLTSSAGDTYTTFMLVVPLFVLWLLVAFVARPLMSRVIKKTPPGELLSEGAFVGITLGALFAGYVTEVSGYRPLLGPFVLGLALPGGMPLGVTCKERLDSFLSGLFLPLYLVLAGYRTDFTKIRSTAVLGSLELFFIICYLGKLLGSVLAGLCFRMPVWDAITVGLMMNIKGITEVFFFNSWGDAEVVTVQHFSVLMLLVLINTAITTPLVKFLYNPTARYISRKRRTIQHTKPNTELRVLTCVHNEDNVPSLLDLLEASNPTHEAPICVTVLHLTELIGQAASVIRPYKKSKHRSNLTASDRIANAFRYFEQQGEGVVSVSSYIAIAPYATMHNDVCALSYNKKACLIILPFHKQSDGAWETAKHTIRSVNSNVLDHAPCSVAILVERGHPTATCNYTNHLLQRVVVFFLGGADDREALAYGMRMSGSGSISLAVVRFTSKGEALLVDGLGARLDEEMLMELKDQQEQNSSIMYIEKMVLDGEGMVAVIQSMSEKFDLLIVGRREGDKCELTSGMSDWSECPELGILGDLLASTDFGEKVSILVVQQQQRVQGRMPVDDQPKEQMDVAFDGHGPNLHQADETKDIRQFMDKVG